MNQWPPPAGGHVFYHVYRSDSTPRSSAEEQRYYEILALAKDDIERYNNHSDFSPTQVVVITWVDMQPAIQYTANKVSDYIFIHL